jgi:hypothetical protein
MIRREELVAGALALLHVHGFVPSIQENGGSISRSGGSMPGGATPW